MNSAQYIVLSEPTKDSPYRGGGVSVAFIFDDEQLAKHIASIEYNPFLSIVGVFEYVPVEYEITQPKVTIKK